MAKADVSLFWWAHLLAVPTTNAPDCWPYWRLHRVWADQTDGGAYFNATSENHCSATLFENFTVFPPSWITDLDKAAGLDLDVGNVHEVNWGYQVYGKNGSGTEKCADIALHFRDEKKDGVVVFEAKRPGGCPGPNAGLKPGDENPATYLDLDSFGFTPRRRLVYLLDEVDVGKAKINDPENRSRIFTWQQLGDLQIQLALQLLDSPLSSFIASAIQYQFAQHGIHPTKLSAPYLAFEPLKTDVTKSLKGAEFLTKGWKLPES